MILRSIRMLGAPKEIRQGCLGKASDVPEVPLPPGSAMRPAILTAEIVVGFVALCARGWHLAAMHASPIFPLLMGDAQVFHDWGTRVAAGDWLGSGVFYQAPLYPYLLGLLYFFFGQSLLAVRLFQIILGTAACVLVTRAGRRFFDPTTGCVAGLMLALYPSAIFFDGLIQKTSLDLFLVALFLLLLAPNRNESRVRWLGTGIVLGCLTLTRENALALVFVALIPLFFPRPILDLREKSVRAGLLAAGLVLILLPVGLRNLVVGGEFHLTTFNFGPNFYIGNGPNAKGVYVPISQSRGNARYEAQDATTLAEQALGRSLSPSEVSSFWTQLTLRSIAANPEAWLRVMLRKVLLLVNRIEVVDTEDQITYGSYSPLLRFLNPWFSFGLLVPLAGAGLLLTWRRRQSLVALYLYLLIYSASLVAFFILSRYRLPLVPVLVLFAAACLTTPRDVLRRQPRLIAAAAALAAALAVVAYLPVAREMVADARATTENNIGAMLLNRGAPAQTVLPYFERAVELTPSFAGARRNLGIVLRMLGRPREALDQFQQALTFGPTADLYTQVGATLIDLGMAVDAVPAYREAVRLDPANADSSRRLAALLSKLGRAE